MQIKMYKRVLVFIGLAMVFLMVFGCPSVVVDELPVDETPIDEAPIEDPPVEDPPIEDPPVEDPPIEDPPIEDPPPVLPVVSDKYPAAGAVSVVVFDSITVTFSQEMNPSTIVASNFGLVESTSSASIAGIVSYADMIAVFNPTDSLAENTTYIAKVTTGVQNIDGIAMAAELEWSFTTGSVVVSSSPLPVNLGTAANYVILAESQITNVPTSVISGHVGLSPAAEAGITGFSQTDVYSGDPLEVEYATSDQITGGGRIYAADMVGGSPNTASILSTAIDDKLTAYNDAFSRATPDYLNIGGGTISDQTFSTGLYRWDSALNLTGDLTLAGSASDIWIFQVVGELNVSSGKSIILSGGAQPQNIFWQVSGVATLGTTSHFEGIILSAEDIRLLTGASLTGRAMAKKQVILQQVSITQPVE